MRSKKSVGHFREAAASPMERGIEEGEDGDVMKEDAGCRKFIYGGLTKSHQIMKVIPIGRGPF